MSAQNTLLKQFRTLNITPGTVYHGSWVSGQVERNRRIYDYEFVCFSGGNGRLITSDTTYYCRAGTVIIVPPRTVMILVSEACPDDSENGHLLQKKKANGEKQEEKAVKEETQPENENRMVVE